MQFTTITTALTLALMASASPLVERTGTTTPAQEVQNKCGATSTASCCTSTQKSVIALIPVLLSVQCTALNLISVGPVAQQCSAQQQVVCCNGAQQTGLINVGTVCLPVAA
ncbi:hypothetical protein G7Y79_00009g025930 [Physcia stellaris]|nr:hypothetical protein G7Y79_00009g025930 [Physcia stellaris]